MKLVLNGREIETGAAPATRLLDFLREEAGLTGTKEGCGKGECGACSVVLDGRLVNACLVLLGQCEGATITTIEGVGTPDRLSPVQEAFAAAGAVQCGFCTPGLVLAGTVLLASNASPSPADVRRAMDGNLCRCTGYSKVEEAILSAADRIRKADAEGEGQPA